jgi:diguanylate cyclase (GGDEF)-like protein/PAS domain S-box-containing protein
MIVKLLIFFILSINSFLLISNTCIADEQLTLRIGIHYNPPIIFQNDHKIKGLYADLLRYIAVKENWKLEFIVDSFEQNLQKLSNNEIDVIAGIPDLQKYDNSFIFSEEDITIMWANVYVHRNTHIEKILDLKNKKIAVLKHDKNTFQNSCIDLRINCKLIITDNYETILNLIETKKVDAGIINNLYANKYKKNLIVKATSIMLNPSNLLFAISDEKYKYILGIIDSYLNFWQRNKNIYFYEMRNKWLQPEALINDKHDNEIEVPLSEIKVIFIYILLAFITSLTWLIILRVNLNKYKKKFYKEKKDLLKREKLYRNIVENIPYGIQEMDIHGRILFTNIADHQIRRYNHGELFGKSIIDMVNSKAEQKALRNCLAMWVKKQPTPTPYYIDVKRKDNKIANIKVDWDYKKNVEGKVIGFFSVITDVTKNKNINNKFYNYHIDLQDLAKKHTVELIDAYNDLLITATIVDNMSEAIMVINHNGHLETINPAFTVITGYDRESILGKSFINLGSKQQSKAFYNKMWKILTEKGCWAGEVKNKHKNGNNYIGWLSISIVKNTGKDKRYVALLSDISKRKNYERQIWHKANYDDLTNLPNRNYFKTHFKRAISQVIDTRNQLVLMFIDLDKFKCVNDSFGHNAGDELLKIVAKRLNSCVSKNDIVARMGGDEFTIILSNIRNNVIEIAKNIAEQVLKTMQKPFKLSMTTVNISASIGIVICPDNGNDMITLLKNADIAMYNAKDDGRNNYCFFE